MKSKLDQQIEDTFYYAVNFYSTNDRSIEKQQFCLNEMQKYGLDLDTCIRIQNPIMSVFQMGELMQIGSEITQQHLNIITNNINKHLLGLQPTLKPETIKELPNIPTIGGTGQGSNKRDIDGVSVQVKNIVQDVTTNGYKGQKALTMSNYDLEAHDMNYLSATMPGNKYNFTLVDFRDNPRVGALGLDYILKGSPGILSVQQGNSDISVMYQGMLTRPSFNIVKLNLNNCNLGDTGADILCHALANGKLLATKNIDVWGNNISDKGAGTIAEALKTGKFSTLKRFDVSGNDISLVGEKFMINALKHESTQDIIILLKKSTDLKNQLKIFYGNKEQKVEALCSKLKEAEAMGIDTKQVAVSKSAGEKISNQLKGVVFSAWGTSKCHIVPDNIKSFAEDIIVGKISKKLELAHNANSLISCYLEHENDRLASESGIESIKDNLVDLVGTSDVCDAM